MNILELLGIQGKPQPRKNLEIVPVCPTTWQWIGTWTSGAHGFLRSFAMNLHTFKPIINATFPGSALLSSRDSRSSLHVKTILALNSRHQLVIVTREMLRKHHSSDTQYLKNGRFPEHISEWNILVLFFFFRSRCRKISLRVLLFVVIGEWWRVCVALKRCVCSPLSPQLMF